MVTDRTDGKCRCRWANPRNPVYIRYHDDEWGMPLHDDRSLFRMLVLESFQAGLSWECVLNKRPAFDAAFDGFIPELVSRYDDEKKAALAADAGIIRNRAKIAAAVTNAAVFLDIVRECGSFDTYLRGFAGDSVIYECGPTTSPLSDAISADLKKRGMKFVGSTVIYAYLQAIGILNAHEPGCFLYHGDGA